MNKSLAVLRLALVAVLSVCTLLYGTVTLAFGNIPVAENSSTQIQSSESVVSGGQQTAEVSSETESASSAPVSSKEQTTTVAEDKTVSGKIISRTIAPSSATNSYGGVYLKNISGAEVNIKSELKTGTDIKISKGDTPQILIVHTHATESYMLEERDYYTKSDASRSTEADKNMIKIGETVAAVVKNAGYAVLHDKTLHDYPSYTGSYNASKATIKSYLKKYPSIKIVIDIHRDAVADGSDKIKLVKEIDGKKAAQVMLVQGSQTGNVEGYPNWRENMRLCMLFHKTLEEMYPSLARPILLTSKLYNQHLTTGSMLIEMGTDANTLEEAVYSAELVGNALTKLLTELK